MLVSVIWFATRLVQLALLQPGATVTEGLQQTSAILPSATHPTSKVMDSYTETTAEFLAETKALLEELSPPDRHTFAWDNVSTENVTTHYVDTLNGGGSPTRLHIMVICGIHGRELYSSDLCRSWLMYHATAANQTKSTVFQWTFVLVANPSGRDLVVQAYRNKQQQVPDQDLLCHRGNGRGVDLNRNWRTYNIDLYQPQQRRPFGDPEYAGEDAFSEAETKNLRTLLEEIRPDVLLAIHTGTVAILTPFDDDPDQIPETYRELSWMAQWMARQSSCNKVRSHMCLVGRGAQMLGYTGRGSMGDFAYRHQYAALPFTLEIYQGKIDEEEQVLVREKNTTTLEGFPTPQACFQFFNPPQHRLAYELRKWKSLWRALYYMNEKDQSTLQQLLIQSYAHD